MPAQGVIVINLEAGDRITVSDPEGLQPGVITALDQAGSVSPGLHSKYFDMDLNPMLEFVQDTVGRHETFGYACTARYYEDQGYFGHPNCSDNFNHSLAEYGVGARAGWEAANFFYNTDIDANNVLHLDEPWSRPGDYVLLKALSDMVCVSSACPDDTTAANGWHPPIFMFGCTGRRHNSTKPSRSETNRTMQ